MNKWMRLDRTLLFLGLVLLATAAAILLGVRAAPALGDYAEWTYHGVLLRNVLQGLPDVGYTLKHYPVPNSLTTLGLGLLMLVLPWQLAAKVWLLVELCLGLGAAYALGSSTGNRQNWSLLVLLPAMLLGIPFWAGFSNFLLGTYLAMLICALLLRGFESRWVYAAVLIATFFSHMIPFGFALLAVGFYALQTARWRLLWQTAPTIALTLWYFVGRALNGNVDGQAGMVASVPYATPLFAAFKVNTYLKCWGFVNPAGGSFDSILLRFVGAKFFLLLFVLNALIAVAVLALMGITCRRAIVCASRDRFLWFAVLMFFAVSQLLPGAAAGISDPGGRMMQVAVWTGVCLAATRHKWVGVGLGTGAIILLAADCLLLFSVAMKPPMVGSMSGPLPARVRQFGHVYYIDHWEDYAAIQTGQMRQDIYPTAMFLKDSAAASGK